MVNNDGKWQFWIDVGGTFTDCLARNPAGEIRTHKLLSSGVYKGNIGKGSTSQTIIVRGRGQDPPHFFKGFRFRLLSRENTSEGVRVKTIDEDVLITEFDPRNETICLKRPLDSPPKPDQTYELYSHEHAPISGIRWLMGKTLEEEMEEVEVRLGTTRGTNALLERTGKDAVFVTTAGFKDILSIAYQNRRKLFALNIKKPRPLYKDVIEIEERIGPDGEILKTLDKKKAKALLTEIRNRQIDSLAICLLHSYRNNQHELDLMEIANELGFSQVSVSSQIASLQRIVPRGDTTVVDAYLTPVIKEYVREVRESLPHANVKMMTSSGALVGAESFIGKDSILSGPAGGVVGAAGVAEDAGHKKIIGFDMGGTSTDISRFDGRFVRCYEMEVSDPERDAGVRIVAPMLAIETVAAGGGSICWFDGTRLRVGPESAGASPGPACYGNGGPLTITDLNVFLGRIVPDKFSFPLDKTMVVERLKVLCDEVSKATHNHYSLEQLASGCLQIASSNMAAPIKKISISKGYDVRDYTLVSFGGAGAQFACQVAEELGVTQILQHPHASVLSAYGIGCADITKFAAQDVGKPYNPSTLQYLDGVFEVMLTDLKEKMRQEKIAPETLQLPVHFLDLRYKGQDSTITVRKPDDSDWVSAFTRQHKSLYGFIFADRPLEVRAARVELTSKSKKGEPTYQAGERYQPKPSQMMRSFFYQEWLDTAVFTRESLTPGAQVIGPALVIENNTSVVVNPGWKAELTGQNNLVLNRIQKASSGKSHVTIDYDPINLTLFNNQFTSIAEQMGATLQRTAVSVNVKERLDFSCAIFSDEGDLVVNAPHIPVHLGAMSDTVRNVVSQFPTMAPGDVFITNDPYSGGSHLPDVTVISPIFDSCGKRVLFYAGNRAHHAEIGGISPGSMPPFSKSLAEEGVLIKAFHLVQNNKASEDRLRRLLSDPPYPSRAVNDNISDINAQVAANEIARQLLTGLVNFYGKDVVKAYMKYIQDSASKKMRLKLREVPEGRYEFSDKVNEKAQLSVGILIRHEGKFGSAKVDFSGTSSVTNGNLNANPAIVRSAVLYCFRCLIDEDIPLNEGVLEPLEIIIPKGSMLDPPAGEDPTKLAAVVGGNVETSQRIVDVILGALGLVAASQGTMNNFLFGKTGKNSRGFGYYETICGGSGAGPSFHGASAVHSHMTNTRITDPEVIEERFPVRVRTFGIRKESGGQGKFCGGNGVVREIEFLDSLEVSLLTTRRSNAPFGLDGGKPGVAGKNLLLRKGAKTQETLKGISFAQVNGGDVLRIETPGGGAYGK